MTLREHFEKRASSEQVIATLMGLGALATGRRALMAYMSGAAAGEAEKELIRVANNLKPNANIGLHRAADAAAKAGTGALAGTALAYPVIEAGGGPVAGTAAFYAPIWMASSLHYNGKYYPEGALRKLTG